MSRTDEPATTKHFADRLFGMARTHGHWTDRPVARETLEHLYEWLRWGPTSANSCPGRFVFLVTQTAKERLRPALAPGNVNKTMSAPCCVIVAQDTRFYDWMPVLVPGRDARSIFAGNAELARETALRNSTLQAGYLIIAARLLGLDVGPMSGFDAAAVDREFFPDGRWKVNLLCNLGHGDAAQLPPRNPRLDFAEACRVL
jgi:3-hydroxypropanoate dehydrogenase